MTNKEKYREELESYAFADAPWGIDTKGNVMCCFLAGNECTQCIFGEKAGECWLNRLEWLNGEYINRKEKAEFEREKMIVLEQMKEYAEPEDAVWDSQKEHWNIAYNVVHNKVVILCQNVFKSDSIYFATIEDAKRCITEVGEDRIKKYYCGVKE